MRLLRTLLSMTTLLTLASCRTARVYDPAADADPQPDETVIYKTIGDTKLQMHIFKPAGHKASDRTPCIVFFHGGGWVGGKPGQFYPHGRYLASRGMVVFSAQYRLVQRGQAPYECVMDAKSAIRWVRSHGEELGVDPNRIAAGGGSAGGQLAAAAGTTAGFEQAGEDLTVSSKPNALVLFNPAYDNGPGGLCYDRVKERWKEFSPMHNISKDTPPAVVFLGTKDILIPVATAEKFRDSMREAGVRSDLHLYEGQPHGFFNYLKGNTEYYVKTLVDADKFLASLGYLKGKPTMKMGAGSGASLSPAPASAAK